jgi:WW domain-binding protein 2
MAQRNGNGMAPPPYEPPGKIYYSIKTHLLVFKYFLGNGWYAAPPPAYTPQPGAYGWLPNNNAFQQPTDGVFVGYVPLIVLY